MDASAFLQPAAAGVGLAGKGAQLAGLGKTASALQRLGKVGGAASVALDPVQVAFRGAVQAAYAPVRLIKKTLPADMYANIARFNNNLTLPQRKALSKMAVDEKLNPTIFGIEKLRNKLNVLGQEMNKAVSEATAGGMKFKTEGLFTGFDDLAKQLVNEGYDSVKIKKFVRDMKHHMTRDKPIRTMDELNKFKIAMNRKLSSVWETHMATTLEKSTALIMRRNAMNVLEAIIPDYKKLNKKWADLKTLEEQITGTANTMQNGMLVQNPVHAIVGTGVGQKFAGTVGGAMVGGAIVLQKPGVRIQLLHAIDWLKKNKPHVKINYAVLDAIMTAPVRHGLTEEMASPDDNVAP